jgi:hypothetical protein
MIRLLILALAPALFTGVSMEGAEVSDSAPAETTSEVAPDSSQESAESASGDKSAMDWVEWAKGWFSPQTLTTLASVLTCLGVVVKCVSEIRRLAKDKQLTIEKVQDLVLTQIKTNLPDDIKAEMDKYLPQLTEYAQKSNDILNDFAKILALSQENTAESRLAILKLIEEMGVISQELVDKAKAEVESQKAAEEKKAEEQKEAVKEVISATEPAKDDGTSI